MEKSFSVSEAARELQCSADWLRQAEKIGKLPQARRNLNSWRVYTQEDLEQIKQLLLPSKDNAY